MIIHPNVHLGEGHEISDFCILGEPPRGRKLGEVPLSIGSNARVRSHTVIYAGNRIGNDFQTGHSVVIRENNQIGDKVSIGTLAALEHENRIGNNVRIHTAAIIGEYVTLEDNTWIGPRTIFLNDPHPPCPRYRECVGAPIVKKNAKIGANSTILPGVTIGKGAMVGSGSVVTKDVPEGTVVLGNPARIVKKVSELKCFKGFYERPYEWEE